MSTPNTDPRAEPQNIPCIVKGNDNPEWDWWTIVRAEHDNREWMQRTGPNSMSFRLSERLGEDDNNADIEGTSAEMLAIATAIESGTWARFTRCSAFTTEKGVELMSPRNMSYPVVITHENARALAKDIREKVTAVVVAAAPEEKATS